jgi:hypothetical protein
LPVVLLLLAIAVYPIENHRNRRKIPPPILYRLPHNRSTTILDKIFCISVACLEISFDPGVNDPVVYSSSSLILIHRLPPNDPVVYKNTLN